MGLPPFIFLFMNRPFHCFEAGDFLFFCESTLPDLETGGREKEA